MTELERETFTDGFRVCLLGVQADRARNALAYAVTLFDGGRPVETAKEQDAYFTTRTELFDRLQEFLVRIAAPPHVLVVYGNGWQDLLAQTLPPARVGELRILELRATAAALKPDLKPGAGIDAIIRAYGINGAIVSDAVDSPVHEDILWGVLAAAGEAGLTWPALLAAKDAARHRPAFERYSFDEAALSALPQSPAVYVMRDGAGNVLYVGKAGNLAARLGSYFAPVAELPAKVDRIRDRIRDFEYQLVGSELEALLLEHRLIAQRTPELNVQRTIKPGKSRYTLPLLPHAIVLPSAQKRRVELFLFGAHEAARQCRVDARRPPAKRLAALIAEYVSQKRTIRKHRRVVDWGPAGNEICGRYFARFRDTLHWIELATAQPPAALTRALLDVVRTVAEHSPAAGEFLLGNGA